VKFMWRKTPSSAIPLFFAMCVVMCTVGLIMIIEGLRNGVWILAVFGLEWIMFQVVGFMILLFTEIEEERGV